MVRTQFALALCAGLSLFSLGCGDIASQPATTASPRDSSQPAADHYRLSRSQTGESAAPAFRPTSNPAKEMSPFALVVRFVNPCAVGFLK